MFPIFSGVPVGCSYNQVLTNDFLSSTGSGKAKTDKVKDGAMEKVMDGGKGKMGGGGVHNPSNRLPAGTSPICPSRETVRCTALTLDTRSTVELFHLFLIITCSLSLQMTLLCWSLRSRRVWVVQVFSWSPCRSSSPCPPSYYPSYYIDTELQT